MWIFITILTLVPTIFGSLNNRASDLYWKKKVGTETVDAVSVKEIDGFIWMYGLSSVEGYRNILIGKYDLEGKKIWVNGYGNKITTIARDENVGIFFDTSFAYTSDGGWVVCGLTVKPENTNANEKWIARVLPNGDFAWSFRVSDSDPAQGVMSVSCGEISTGFILVSDSGRCGSLPKSLFKCLLATHFDFDGNLIKSIAHGDTRNTCRGQAVMTGKGVIAGHHEIAKLDENGDYEFGYALKIDGVSFESVRVYLGAHCELSDSSIVSAGTINCASGQNYYIQRLKPWDSGAIDWAWRIGNCDEPVGRFFCSELSDNTTLIQITTMTTPYVKNIRFSRNGTILETFSSPGFISGIKFTELNHTQFLAAFPTLHKYSHVEQETYIWKFDREEGFICEDDKDVLMNSSYSFNDAFEDVTATVTRTTITPSSQAMTSFKTAFDLRLSQTKYENSEKIVDKFVCYKHKLWCHGFTRVDTANVCAGHGECIANNNCSCDENYWPQNNCSQFECYKIRSKAPEVCNFRNGTCSSVNNCTCNGGYYGDECEKWNCAGIYYNDSDTKPCSSHGDCTRPNNCECAENYNASLTCDWKCGEYRSGESGACSKHGSCVGYNNCSCLDGYSGSECEYWSCYGIFVNDASKSDQICGGFGSCVDLDVCHCLRGYSSSVTNNICDQWYCGEYFRNETGVCNSHGNCTSHYQCTCETGYLGDLCESLGYWSCFGIPSTDLDNACGGKMKGECVSQDKCVCDVGYRASTPDNVCDIWFCGIYLYNDTSINSETGKRNICSGRGECTAPNSCDCGTTGFSGSSCEKFTCGGFDPNVRYEYDDTQNACSGNGLCTGPGNCTCYSDSSKYYAFFGSNCELKVGRTMILATMRALVIYFEARKESFEKFGIVKGKSFHCSRIIQVNTQKESSDRVNKLFSKNCSVSSTNEFLEEIGKSLYLHIDIAHINEDDFLAIMKVTDGIIPLLLDGTPFDMTIYPTHETLSVSGDTKHTIRSFLRSSDLSEDGAEGKVSLPSEREEVCKERLVIDPDLCILMYECYPSPHTEQEDVYSNFKYFSVGYMPSLTSERYFYAKYYYQDEISCKSGLFREYRLFSKISCHGSNFGDSWLMYERCSEDVAAMMFQSSVLGYFMMTTSPLYVVVVLLCCCCCVFEINFLLFCSRKCLLWCGLYNCLFFCTGCYKDAWRDERKKIAPLRRKTEWKREEENVEEEHEEFEITEYTKHQSDSSELEKNEDDEVSTDEVLEEETQGEDSEKGEDVLDQECVEYEARRTPETLSEEEELEEEVKKSEGEEMLIAPVEPRPEELSVEMKKTLDEIELLAQNGDKNVPKKEENEETLSVQPSPIQTQLERARFLLRKIQKEIKQKKDISSFPVLSSEEDGEFYEEINTERNKKARTKSELIYRGVSTKSKSCCCKVCACFSICCCCGCGLPVCCCQEVIKSFCIIFGILVKESFALWFSSSEFLSDSDIDASNPYYILLTSVMTMNSWVIWGSMALYVFVLFCFILLYVRRFMSDSLMFCIAMGSLKEYVYYRFFKALTLLWFMCINLFCYIVKFAYLDATEQQSSLANLGFWFGIIFPESLLLFSLLEVCSYNGVSSNAHLKRLKKIGCCGMRKFPDVKIGFGKVFKDVDVILEDFFQLIFLVDKGEYIKFNEQLSEEVDQKHIKKNDGYLFYGNATSGDRRIVEKLANSDEYGHLSWDLLDGLNMEEILYLKNFFFPRDYVRETYWTVFHHHRIASSKWVLSVIFFPLFCLFGCKHV